MKALLMGGQACILYGAAEFSRDIDFAIAVSPGNIDRLRAALEDLKAEPIFFPPLSREVLVRGHACHFRCLASGLHRFRIDVMAVMRGVDSFEGLWRRRRRIHLPRVGAVALVSLPDLVRIKKTQRDKDWPMIRRLVEADVAAARRKPTPRCVGFWLLECRTPDLLKELVGRYPKEAERLARRRPAVRAAMTGKLQRVVRELRREEDRERAADRRYWAPLRAELERWRMDRRMS